MHLYYTCTRPFNSTTQVHHCRAINTRNFEALQQPHNLDGEPGSRYKVVRVVLEVRVARRHNLRGGGEREEREAEREGGGRRGEAER